MQNGGFSDEIFGENFDEHADELSMIDQDELLDLEDIDDVDFYDEFTDDLDEDEFDSIVVESIDLRTAILQKDDMIGLLGIMSASSSATICRVDPRESTPAYQLYEDVDAAKQWFSKSLGTSRRNGWDVLYDGLPLRG